MRVGGACALGTLLAAASSSCSFNTAGVQFDDGGGQDSAMADAATDAQPIPDAGIDAAPADTSLAVGDVRLLYADVTSIALQSLRWSRADGTWTMEEPTLESGGGPLWVVNQVSPQPSAEEIVTMLVDRGGARAIVTMMWEGDAWVQSWGAEAALVDATKRGFDLAFEESGDAMVVYAMDGPSPIYRTWSDGIWSAGMPLPVNDGPGPKPDTNLGRVRWVELERRPGTDEIGLVYSDENSDLVSMVWDGTAWIGDSAITLETDLKRNNLTQEVSNRSFDMAYSAISGDLMVAWARNGWSNFIYAVRRPVTGQWFPSAQAVSGVLSGQPHFIDLAGEPNGDRIAAAFYDLGDGTERLGVTTWNGTDWIDKREVDSQTWDVNDTATGDTPGGVAWVGSSGIAIAVYSDNQEDTLDWTRWTPENGWQQETDIDFPGKAFTESAAVQRIPGEDRLLVTLSDSDLRLYAATYDGFSWQLSNLGAPLTTSVRSKVTVPFSLAARR